MDAPLVRIFLAGPPRGKGRPKVVLRPKKGGGMRPTAITPDATLDYEARLRSVALHAMAGRPPLSGSLDILMVATFEIRESWPKSKKADALAGRIRPGDLGLKSDWDNIAKMTDALNGIVWTDDVCVDDGTVRRFFGAEPGLSIEVRKAEVEPPLPAAAPKAVAAKKQPELAL